MTSSKASGFNDTSNSRKVSAQKPFSQSIAETEKRQKIDLFKPKDLWNKERNSIPVLSGKNQAFSIGQLKTQDS